MSRLLLESTRALPRTLSVARHGRTWIVSVYMPGMDWQVACAVAERLNLRPGSLWAGDAAFEVLPHEAEAISRFANIPLPCPTRIGSAPLHGEAA